MAGDYGGIPLSEWPARLPDERPSLETLLGPAFRKLPEALTYPLAGLLFGRLVEAAGLDKVKAHLYGATPEGFAEACRKAGLSPERVAALLR